jgi:hypothetical protein
VSDNVIDLGAERSRREEPSPDLVRTDEYGRKLYTFLLSYQVGESEYGTEVLAYDFADAEARVAGMRASLAVLGKAYDCIQV